jgi:hypothetical protein
MYCRGLNPFCHTAVVFDRLVMRGMGGLIDS